MTTLNH